MAEHEPVPEADAQEQALTLADDLEAAEVEEIPPDVPEADALEQARPVADLQEGKIQFRPDVPEADALEQDRPAGDEDDDDWR